jgi:hypothetical protein
LNLETHMLDWKEKDMPYRELIWVLGVIKIPKVWKEYTWGEKKLLEDGLQVLKINVWLSYLSKIEKHIFSNFRTGFRKKGRLALYNRYT